MEQIIKTLAEIDQKSIKIMEANEFVYTEPTGMQNTWKEVFGNDNPIHIEIGMGKGKFITTLAMMNPDINYVGIEKYSSVLLRAVEKQDEQRLPNLRFIRMDAEAITDVFGEGEVSRIYLNFSDPWPKDRHAKRRLTSKEFFARYDVILKSDGEVQFKTDNRILFDFSVEEVKIVLSVISSIASAFSGMFEFSIMGTVISMICTAMIPMFVMITFIRVIINIFRTPQVRTSYDNTYYENKTNGKSEPLPKSVSKRKRILNSFNQKYELCLTEAEVGRIVDASYISMEWQEELTAMQEKYETIFQWYAGNRDWLRAYLYVFKVQNISSDFTQQKQICLDSFDEIFRYSNFGEYDSIELAIKKINEVFYTTFDETTFMIAHRFLRNNGKEYELGKVSVVKSPEDDIEQLKDKYEEKI